MLRLVAEKTAYSQLAAIYIDYTFWNIILSKILKSIQEFVLFLWHLGLPHLNLIFTNK